MKMQNVSRSFQNLLLRPVIFSGASGVGKSTLLSSIMARHPTLFGFSVSHTTRKARPAEVNERDYYFVSKDGFLGLKKQNEFLESTEFAGNFYGTSRSAVYDVLSRNQICILDVDLQGVKQLRVHPEFAGSLSEDDSTSSALFICILPPCQQALEQRLRNRGTETEQSIQLRLQHAEKDSQTLNENRHLFHHFVINSELTQAIATLEHCLRKDIEKAMQLQNI